MRIRSIKPEFFEHEGLGEITRDCRLLFIGLWCMADKNGCLPLRVKRIRAKCLPYDDDVTAEVLLQWLHSLGEAGFIQTYTAKNSREECIYIPGFVKHQKLTSWEKKDSQQNCEPPEFLKTSEALQQDCGSTSDLLPSEERRGEDRRVSLREASESEVTSKSERSPNRPRSKYSRLFDALVSTDKFAASLTEAHVAQSLAGVMDVNPEDEAFVERMRLESTGMVGKVGHAIPWLHATAQRVVKERSGEVDPDDQRDDPRSRRAELEVERMIDQKARAAS